MTQQSRWSKLRPEESGPGVYRFLIGDALLKCSEAAQLEDWRFHVAVEWMLSLAMPLLEANGWGDEMKKVLIDEETRKPLGPDDDLTRWHRYGQIRAAMKILREQGVFGAKDKPFVQASDVFSATSPAKPPKTPKKTDDEDEDEDEEP